jgi:hypothetical protein
VPVQRYTGSPYEPNELNQLTGDLSFAGLDSKTVDPGLLASGMYHRAENYRLVQGTLVPRLGMIPPPAINSINYGTILGVGVFYDADSIEFVCVGNSQGVWVTTPGESPFLVTLAGGAVIQGPCQFIQAFNQLFLFQGPDIAPLFWNGDITSQFSPIPPPSNPFLSTMPNATYAEYVYSTLFVPVGKDQIVISLINSYTDFFDVLDQLRINSGQDDPLVRILNWVNGAVICFKSQSIFILTNANQPIASISSLGVITPNPNVVLQQVSDHIGLVAQKAIARYGTEVLFMDTSGIYQISQVFEGQPQQAAIPMSWPIQMYFDRINKNAMSGVVGIAHREYAYFAVPLDSSTRNNCLLVYNIQFSRWEGVDFFGDPNFYADDMIFTTMNGEKKICLVDKMRGIITLYEEGLQDITGSGGLNSGQFWIPTVFQSRGYALNTGDTRVRFRTAEIRMSGWQPTYSITVSPESAFSTQQLCSGRAKNNTKYLTVGTPDWVNTNVNLDWNKPFRQDYSIYLGSGFYIDNGGGGSIFETDQAILERFRVRRVSNSCSLIISNVQGGLQIKSIMFDTIPVDRSEKSWGG